MARKRRTIRLALARVWAYPLWRSLTSSPSADTVTEDVDWWMRCIGDPDLLQLDKYSQFAYLSGALTEFRTLIHYRLRAAPLALNTVSPMPRSAKGKSSVIVATRDTSPKTAAPVSRTMVAVFARPRAATTGVPTMR
jgi:hypothetical protein